MRRQLLSMFLRSPILEIIISCLATLECESAGALQPCSFALKAGGNIKTVQSVTLFIFFECPGTFRAHFQVKGEQISQNLAHFPSLSLFFFKSKKKIYFGTKSLLLLFSSCNMVLQLLSSINKHHPESYCIIKPLSLKEHFTQ